MSRRVGCFLMLVGGLLQPGSGLCAEQDAFTIHTIPVREERKLIVNALDVDPSGRVAFATVRGQVWLLEDPMLASEKYSDYDWNLFALGLRSPTEIRWQGEDLVVRQLTESTRLIDDNDDGKAEQYQAADPLSIEKVDCPMPGFVWCHQPIAQGPFAGQFLGGSQIANHLVRLDVSQNRYCLFVYGKGLQYPVDALDFLPDGSLLVAQSNRREPDRSRTRFALQRVAVQVDRLFEVQSVAATENGFRLSFTDALLESAAGEIWAYQVESLSTGQRVEVKQVQMNDDEKSVDLIFDGFPEGKAFHISCDGVWSKQRQPIGNPKILFVVQ